MVAQATLLLFGSFFVMLLAGVPISAGIGIASIFTALFSMNPAIFALTAAQRCFSGIDSFSLLALPFFSLGGNIMNKGGIAKRLVRLARLAVGKMPGYLAATNVLANMFFGAVSGSSVAATSAMGSIMAPLELDEGYDPNYSAAVNICSAPTGILIPPSGPPGPSGRGQDARLPGRHQRSGQHVLRCCFRFFRCSYLCNGFHHGTSGAG